MFSILFHHRCSDPPLYTLCSKSAHSTSQCSTLFLLHHPCSNPTVERVVPCGLRHQSCLQCTSLCLWLCLHLLGLAIWGAQINTQWLDAPTCCKLCSLLGTWHHLHCCSSDLCSCSCMSRAYLHQLDHHLSHEKSITCSISSSLTSCVSNFIAIGYQLTGGIERNQQLP